MEKNHKPALGGVKEATERHIVRSRDDLRKNRRNKMEKRRMQPKEFGGLHTELISSLSPSLNSPQDVADLAQVLHFGEAAEPYYGPQTVIDIECKGPWIFPQGTPKFNQLVALLSNTKDIHVLLDVTSCLISISAHPEKQLWVPRIMGCIEPLLQMLPHVPAVLQENIIWLFANMCYDSIALRNRIVGEARLINFLLSGTFQGQVVTFLFRSFFGYTPFPFEPKDVAPLWKKLSTPLFVDAPSGDYNDEILCAAYYMMRVDSFSHALLQDEIFLHKLLDNREREDCVQILVTFAQSYENHPTLLRLGLLDGYLSLLQARNPKIRIDAGLALSFMAGTREALPHMCNARFLGPLETQMNCTDRMDMRRQVYWTFCALVETAHNAREEENAYPIMVQHNVIRYMADVLPLSVEPELLRHAVKCIYYLKCWEEKLVKNQLEELGALALLSDLQTSSIPGVADLAIKCF